MNKVFIVFTTKNGSEVFGTSAAVIINYGIGTNFKTYSFLFLLKVEL